MQIEFLADHAELIHELARLHFLQWGYLRPDDPLAHREQRLAQACGRGGVPSVVVALEEGALLGSAMLVASDMATRPDLSPWLAGVYVVAEARGRGYASALVRRIEAEAAAAGVERLYLYTPNAMDLYGRLGWELDEHCTYLGQHVAIMSKRIGATPTV